MRDHDALGLTALILGYTIAALLVPTVDVTLLAQPAFGGVLGAAALVTLIVVLRARGRRGSPLERRCLAVFLAMMPGVYVTSWLHHREDARWLAIELGGQLAFAGLAIRGVRGSPWVLSLGIAAHGLLWDSWHYGRAPFIDDWYVTACVVVDLAFALYVATQARAFEEADERRRGA